MDQRTTETCRPGVSSECWRARFRWPGGREGRGARGPPQPGQTRVWAIQSGAAIGCLWLAATTLSTYLADGQPSPPQPSPLMAIIVAAAGRLVPPVWPKSWRRGVGLKDGCRVRLSNNLSRLGARCQGILMHYDRPDGLSALQWTMA